MLNDIISLYFMLLSLAGSRFPALPPKDMRYKLCRITNNLGMHQWYCHPLGLGVYPASACPKQ